MNKKKEISRFVVCQCLAYIAIGGLSYWIGRNTQKQIFNDRLDYMARTGATISNVVDGKDYRCSVTEIIK